VLLSSTAIGLGLAVYALRHRSVPAAVPFAAVAALSAGLALVHGLDLLSVDFATKLLLARLRFVFVAPLLVSQLLLAARYTGADGWLTRRTLGLLLVVPAMAILLALFDRSSLFRYGYRLDLLGPLPLLRYENGPLLLAYAIFNGGLVFGFLISLARWLRSAPVLHARPTLLLAAAVGLPASSEGLFLIGVTPIAGYNFTPLIFVFSYLLLGWAIFRNRLLGVSPIARVTVVEAMPDAALVLDNADRVSDLNLAARRSLGLEPEHVIGHPIAEVLAR
jgi:PAS domain-containing protein